MKNLVYFDTTDAIVISEVGEEDCLLDFDGTKVVLSHEAVYDLAIRLALLMQRIDDRMENMPENTSEVMLN